jgi:hypothetical protein
MAAYQSLCKKLEDGRRTAVVVDAAGIKTPADAATFRGEKVWQILGTGIAPINPSEPGVTGELYIEEREAEQPKNRGGRPPTFPWDEFFIEIIRRANMPDGLPETQAELEREMSEWCDQNWGDAPGESTIRGRIAAVYAAIRKGRKPRG